jgi:deoxyhypusine synthase
MNLARLDLEGFPIKLSAQLDVLHSAAIPFHCPQTGFVEIGGGGPKNFIQQTGPTISQILGVEFEGAERGLQVSTAVEREGSLSSCTFSEAVTWGKYKTADDDKLVQIWGEYSIVLPILAAFVLSECKAREPSKLIDNIPDYAKQLIDAYEAQ